MRKLHLVAATAVLCLGAMAASLHPGLTEVKRVYLLPMTSGLDQYLANRLTREGRFQIVTNAADADAVFTDRLGPAFEDKWKELYPPPPPPEDVKDEKDEKAATGKGTADERFSAPPVTRISSFSRGKGNVFLVSRKTGAVVWSHYRQPKSTRSKEMDNTADAIADRLHEDAKVRK